MLDPQPRVPTANCILLRPIFTYPRCTTPIHRARSPDRSLCLYSLKMASSKSSRRYSTQLVINPPPSYSEEQVPPATVDQLVMSQTQPGPKRPSFFYKFILSEVTSPKDVQGPNRLVSRKPISQPYPPSDNAPSQWSVSSPEWQAQPRIHKSTSANFPQPVHASYSGTNSPNLSPVPSPAVRARNRNGSLSSPPTFADVGTDYPGTNASNSRPNSGNSDGGDSEGGKLKRRSWLGGVGGGRRLRANSQGDPAAHSPAA